METIHEGLENKEFPSYIGKTEEQEYSSEGNGGNSQPVQTEEPEETAMPTDMIEEPTDDNQQKPTQKPIESIETIPPIIEPTEVPIQPDPPEEEPDLPEKPEEPEEPEDPEEGSVG